MSDRVRGFWASLNWDDWIYGLIYGAIGGGSSSVYAAFGALIVDPHDFAFGSAKSFRLIGWVFAFSALMSAFLYLKQKPLPEMKRREETVEVTEVKGKPVATVTTVKETSVVPVKPPETNA